MKKKPKSNITRNKFCKRNIKSTEKSIFFNFYMYVEGPFYKVGS